MLKTLAVWNFALIEQIKIDFSDGLNILTGETGAGKSIVIDAVGAILGKRMSAEYIRNGCDWLRVEAVFDITNHHEIKKFLINNGIVESEDYLIISRKVSKTAKNIITINDCQVTLMLLKQIGELLVDMHGQHENQTLFRTDNQFSLVDNCDSQIKERLNQYRQIYQIWRKEQALLQEREDASREHAQRMDMLRWQTDEIAAAKLQENEDDQLEAEIKILSNAEKIADLAKRSYVLLELGDKGHSAIIPSLVELKKNIETISRYDEGILNTLEMVSESLCQLEECSYEVRDYGERLEYNPDRLAKLQERMDLIYKLRKKYGATIADVLTHFNKAKRELLEIENYDEIIAESKAKIQLLATKMNQIADEISKMRRQIASHLAKSIENHLVTLGMPNAHFEIEIYPSEKLHHYGADNIRILFSANLGEEPKPIQKVASGGELSRIALAIKAVCAAKDNIGVMIFDEIDTGIGGKTAQMVAERIAMVAIHKQVLCITHLAQIACMADLHLYIEKQTESGKTTTYVKSLSADEHLTELARMASGVDLTQAALDNVIEMVKSSQIKKNKWKKEARF